MKDVWLIWECWSKSWMWAMYEQDGELLVFETKEAAEEFVRLHPWLIHGDIEYNDFSLRSTGK